MLSMSPALWVLDRRAELAALVKRASQEQDATDEVRARARSARALVLSATDDPEPSRERGLAALDGARQTGDKAAEATALWALAQTSARAGRDVVAAKYLAARRELLGFVNADEIHDRRSQEQRLRLLAARGLEQLARGNLRAARVDASTVMGATTTAGSAETREIARTTAAVSAILQGDRAQARSVLSGAGANADGASDRVLLRYAGALLAEMDGDHATAASSFDGDVVDHLERGNWWNRDWMVDAVRIGVQAHDTALAERAAAVAHDYERLNRGSVLAAGWSLQTDGLVSHDPAVLGRAVRELSRSARPLVVAAAHEDHGRLLLEVDRRAQAVAALTAAWRLYAATPADAASGRVGRELRMMGVSMRTVRPRQSSHGWESLTPAQVDVARSVAQGCSNKQVADALGLSPYTVASHLRGAFRKLGVSSRVQLTRIVMEAS
jgi:DNA-binding CsgD family transcriptional regulator